MVCAQCAGGSGFESHAPYKSEFFFVRAYNTQYIIYAVAYTKVIQRIRVRSVFESRNSGLYESDTLCYIRMVCAGLTLRALDSYPLTYARSRILYRGCLGHKAHNDAS